MRWRFQGDFARSHLEGQRQESRRGCFPFPLVPFSAAWEFTLGSSILSSSASCPWWQNRGSRLGLFRKCALMAKEISAQQSFPIFLQIWGGGQLITWWFAAQCSAAREHNGVWEKSRCDPWVAANRENDNLLLWPFKCLLLRVISPFIEGESHIVAWVTLPPSAPSFQVVLRLSVHVLTSSICSTDIFEIVLLAFIHGGLCTMYTFEVQTDCTRLDICKFCKARF